MFNLEPALRAWRGSLTVAGALSADQLDELESHLLDAIAALHARGLSPEEAFLVAVRRLGPPAAIELEYARENPAPLWRARLLWMVSGAFLFHIAVSAGLIGSSITAAVAAQQGLHGALLSLATASAMAGGFVLALGAMVVWLRRARPGSAGPRRTLAILAGILLAVLSPILSALHLPLIARFATVDAVGRSAHIHAILSFIASLLLPILLGAALGILARRRAAAP